MHDSFDRQVTKRSRLKRIGKWLAVAAAMGVVSITLLLALLWLEHTRPLELPLPTGPFAVGRVRAGWVDVASVDRFASSPNQKRELVVWLWYPARPDGHSTAAEYLPGPWSSALAEHAGILLTQFLNRSPARINAHSFEDAELAPDKSTYPVIILRSGIGALALDYTTIAEDLASHGYIVVGADTPYSTSIVVMPDGRIIHKTTEGNPGDAPVSAAELERLLEALIKVWSADTKFLLDELSRLNADDPSGKFTGRLDLGAIGVVGHSFGGATAAQFCHDDARCTAGIDIDGALYGSVVREGLTQPFLFLLSDHADFWYSPDLPDLPDYTIAKNIRSAANRIPGDRLIVTLRGADHFSFSDQALVKSQIVMKALSTVGIADGLDAREGLAHTRRYVCEFFDVHLRGAPREALYRGPLMSAARFETK
ncbi:MAG: family membership [Planctomycetes bacterium]|nr:family membership [Planctomycetota bacterium]